MIIRFFAGCVLYLVMAILIGCVYFPQQVGREAGRIVNGYMETRNGSH